MALDLWFQEDVARMLSSVHDTMLSSTRATASESDAAASDSEAATSKAEAVAAYQQGFVDALRAISMAFGLHSTGVAGWQGEQEQPQAPSRALPEPRGSREWR